MIDIMKLPVNLDKKIKGLVEQAYFSAVKDVGEFEYVYIENKIGTKMQVTENNILPWVSRLSQYYSILNDILKDHEQKNVLLSENTIKAIAAAIFYFINPYDIIHDFTPKIGYADDYYVLILCLESICEKDRKIIIKKLSDIE